MQEDMQEEDELSLLDYRTPKGQLIKLLEQKIKKPEIDDTLGQVLDQFSQLTNEQTAFLNNGIFNMNFAEDALLLQSCGQYYAKRVDKLWDELLQFHTRMVKYDETTAKNCTDSNKREARKLEIAKLEERLNRGKRKKIVLIEPENDKEVRPTNGCFIFDIDQSNCSELFNNLSYPFPDEGEIVIEEQPIEPFEDNTELLDEWRAIRHIDDEENRRNCDSVLVAQYHRLRYRFKHYSTPSSIEMIYDLSDPEEFNTREGRLISYHHIKHLFDYNDRCLLPDEDFFVANLRIAFYLKKKWLIKNHINPDTPYETYKEDWEKYENDFLANEKRKIHNMPQSNPEELMRFYKALAKKEQIAIQKVEKLRKEGVKNLPIISFETVIVAPVKEGYEGIFDPYIPEDFELPPPVVDISEEAHPLDGDHEAELSTLLADASKLPDPNSMNPLEKPRSDSGYFDGGFADDESDHEDQPEVAKTGSDTPFEFDKENTDNKENETSPDVASTMDPEITNNEGVQVPDQSDQHETGEIESVTALDINANEQPVTPVELQEDSAVTSENPFDQTCEPQLNESAESTEIPRTDQNASDINRDEMNNAIKEFAKYATVDQDLVYTALENSYFNQTEDMITIVYDKPEGDDSDIESIHGDRVMVFGYFYKEDELRVTKRGLKLVVKNNKGDDDVRNNKGDKVQESKKRKLVESLEDYPLPKRRKLSQRQIETLRRSLIEPVKEQKWENFFSLNYQSETGEGDVTRVEYESDLEDEDLLDDEDVNDADSMCESNDESNEIGLSQDSGVNVDTTVNETVEEPQNAPEPSEPQQDAPICTERYALTDLSKIDLLADISKTTGISREQLQMVEDQTEATKLTPYEQEREKARERVAEWKEHIMPKLKKLDEHDFDIHEYGAKIMDGLTADEPKPFGELVNGKSSAEVVRFFISSLQLANTMNVDICGAKKGELSNDTFKLKLLNKERYHEHFQEYQAPSEETLRERLKKVKEIRMQNKAKKKHTATKRKTSDEQEYQPQTTPKIRKPSTKTYSKPAGGSATPKKITILNCNIINSRREQTINRPSTSRQHLQFDLPQPSTSPSPEKQQTVEQPIGSSQHFDFQQPSTSRQADVWDQQGAFESVLSDVPQPSTRASIDSGFMPSCDEDFLEQFDQLQQITDSPLGSTPEKPRKIVKIKLVQQGKPN